MQIWAIHKCLFPVHLSSQCVWGGRVGTFLEFFFLFSPKAGWWDREVEGRQQDLSEQAKGKGGKGREGKGREGKKRGFSQDRLLGFVDLFFIWRNPWLPCVYLFIYSNWRGVGREDSVVSRDGSPRNCWYYDCHKGGGGVFSVMVW